jgi:hypothetical protein
MTNWNYNDGGRELAGFKGSTGDCVVRAIAIATNDEYLNVYNKINGMGKSERITKRKKSKSNSRTGVYRVTYHKYLLSLGWKWTPTMTIGSGCKVHIQAEELPSGTVIARVSKHLTCMIDGVIQDTYDCSRDGNRCVYGYYTKDCEK